MASQPSELIHAMVLREMQDGVIRDGLWAQAMVEAKSDKDKAKSIYIRLRAEAMQQDTPIAIGNGQARIVIGPMRGTSRTPLARSGTFNSI